MKPESVRTRVIDWPPRPGLLWGGAALGSVGAASVILFGTLEPRIGLLAIFLPLIATGLGAGLTAFEAARSVGVSRSDRGLVLMLACCFPIWGTLASLMGCCVCSPLLCSLCWAAMLSIAFGPCVWTPMTLLGGASCLVYIAALVVMSWIDTPASNLMTDPISIAIPMVAWHLAHPVVLRRIAWTHHTEGVYCLDHCDRCGYDLRGLETWVCPECGDGFPAPPSVRKLA